MFTINDLLRDTSLESSIVFSSEEHRKYKACNLVTDSYTPNDATLWIADAQFVGISCANGEGILFVCRTEPENITEYSEMYQTCEIAVIVSELPATVIFSQLQSAAVKRIEPLLNEAALAESLFSKRTLSEIVYQATMMIKSPIMLTTSSYKILAMNDAGLNFYDPIWEEAAKTGYCSADSIMHFESEDITRQVWQRKEAFILDKGLAKKIPRILQKIEVFGKISAYIGVFQIDRVFSEQDLKMVDLICKALAVAMEKDPKILNYTTDICQSILLDLIDGQITSVTLLHDRMRSAYWNPHPNFRCAVLLPDDASKGMPNADYIRTFLSYQLEGSKMVHIDNGLMVLLNYCESGVKEPYDEVLCATAEKYGLSVGISDEFRELINLRYYYSSALETIRINDMLHNNRHLTYFCDIIFYALVDHVNSVERITYEQSKYKLLVEHDRKNGTEFCKTLAAYIDCGCSSTLTSKKLFIHRNTITHRLKKIEDISGINLKSGQELLHFYLSGCITEWNRTENGAQA